MFAIQILFMIKGILGSFQVFGFILNFKDNYYRQASGNGWEERAYIDPGVKF